MPSRLRECLWLEAIKDRQNIAWLRPLRIVGVDLAIDDIAILTDHVTSRHRQCPTIVAVEAGERTSEPCVNLSHTLRYHPTQTESRSDFAAAIAQDGKGQIILSLRFSTVWRCLLRDGY